MFKGKKQQLLTIPLAVERGTDALRESNAAHAVWMSYVDNDPYSPIPFQGRERNGFVWFPKSQIHEFVKNGESVSFWCPEWLIEAKGVEAYIDTSYMPTLFDE